MYRCPCTSKNTFTLITNSLKECVTILKTFNELSHKPGECWLMHYYETFPVTAVRVIFVVQMLSVRAARTLPFVQVTFTVDGACGQMINTPPPPCTLAQTYGHSTTQTYIHIHIYICTHNKHKFYNTKICLNI